MADNYRRYSNSTEEEVVLNERSCFGLISAFVCLPLIAVLNFFIDIGAACLSIGSDFIYVFGVLAVFSLFCLGAIISGVQEEQSAKIKLSIGWTAVKAVVLILVIGCLVIALTDLDWFVEQSRLNVNTNVCIALLLFLPVSLLLMIIQFVWLKQMLTIIAIRDQLYIIPCEVGPVAMRNSLRAHFDDLKAKKGSISTVSKAEKY